MWRSKYCSFHTLVLLTNFWNITFIESFSLVVIFPSEMEEAVRQVTMCFTTLSNNVECIMRSENRTKDKNIDVRLIDFQDEWYLRTTPLHVLRFNWQNVRGPTTGPNPITSTRILAAACWHGLNSSIIGRFLQRGNVTKRKWMNKNSHFSSWLGQTS